MTNDAHILITFAIPCYNVEKYVDHCVETILQGTQGYHDRIEIILVDDGSTKDATPQRVDYWQDQYPAIIRAIHQANGGHGEAVNAGLRNASGHYFKVVDADDWLDDEATHQLMSLIAGFVDGSQTGSDSERSTRFHHFAKPAHTEVSEGPENPETPDHPVDLIITNYVYEKVFEGTRNPVRYKGVLPEGHVFGWSAVGAFKPYQNILMHSVVYRTSILRAAGLELPKHTFYVDNIFVYVPLPSVERIYYLNVDMYRYFIGREDQSVNEKTMASRIDQQLLITRIMIDAFVLDKEVPDASLRAYMGNYLTMMMVICSVFLLLSKRDDAEEQRAAIWAYLQEHNPGVYRSMRYGFLGRGVNLRGRLGHAMTIAGYRFARKLFKFN